ncbi:Conserved_hypothetical protein [Hexamita inflata]|uniref:Uncharacterized protein n=1 Tax=Hexamita inflata TaxID=28002 RepID=A0AA86TQ40_9EUKA|nr:Conserved hypothetical protein [Hexamita inflata]CAI9953112.1 Conserved hypothetical protein [Hexamita inflata]
MASETYVQECDKLCIPVIPLIQNILEQKPEIFDLSRAYVGDKQAVAIAQALKIIKPKQVLMPQNGLMNFGTRSLLSGLEGSNIEVLDIGKNDFAPSCIKDICRFVINTPKIKEVRVLQCSHIKPEHVRQIQDAFQKRK